MGKLFDAITETEKDMIKNYIFAYGPYAAGRKEAVKHFTSLETILAPWEAAKNSFLANLFDGQLILEKEFMLEKDTRDLEKEFDEANFTFFDNYRTVMSNAYENRTLLYKLLRMIYIPNLILNRWDEETFVIRNPKTDKMIKIEEGSKIVKALGKIAEAYDIEGFEEFRLKHSLILNQKTFKGTFCLSIHPLDYMTMSDNNSGWDSCMSWKHYGCYRQGTVEMMNSPMVVVAYLKGSKDMNMPKYNKEDGSILENAYSWNNKKWRELIVVNENILTNILSYPYNNPYLTRTALNWIKDLASAKNVQYGDFVNYFWDDYSEGGIDYLEDFYVDVETDTTYMYNDFGRNDSEGQWAALSNSVVENKQHHIYFNYSGVSEDVMTGQIIDSYSLKEDFDSELLVRYAIQGYKYCVYCGCWHPASQFTTAVHRRYSDSEVICDNCLIRYFGKDITSGEFYEKNEMIKISILHDTSYNSLIKKKFPDVEEEIENNSLFGFWEDKGAIYIKDFDDINKIFYEKPTILIEARTSSIFKENQPFYNGLNTRYVSKLKNIRPEFLETIYGVSDIEKIVFKDFFDNRWHLSEITYLDYKGMNPDTFLCRYYLTWFVAKNFYDRRNYNNHPILVGKAQDILTID